MSDSKPLSGAISFERLVGRREELATLRAASRPPSEDSACHILLVMAEGGYGKTHLLRTVERESAADNVVILPLIDLADPALHNSVNFLLQVRGSLLERYPERELAARAFQEFNQRVDAYDQATFEEADFGQRAQLASQAVRAFMAAYEALTEKVRVVWLLDTMEQLVGLPSEIEVLIEIERQSLDAWIAPSTYRWIEELIAVLRTNTTLVLSGRPNPPRWIERINRAIQEIAQAHSVLAGITPDSVISIQTLQLQNFTAGEVGEYLEVLAEQLRPISELARTAAEIDVLRSNADLMMVLHTLTEGKPIRLGISIDLLRHGGSMPEVFTRPFGELPIDEAALQELRHAVDDELLNYIGSQIGTDTGQVLNYLSVTRRGLDAGRLVNLWSNFEQVGDTGLLAEAEQVLQSLAQLSFVKQRDGRFFLHDEFYTLYQQRFGRFDPAAQAAAREYQQFIFAKMAEFCERSIAPLTDRLAELRDQLSEIDAGPEEERAAARPVSLQLQQLLDWRRRLQAELVHYHLYLNPQHGVNTVWFEFSSQALSSDDIPLDVQIRSEVDLFFFGIRPDLNRLQVGLSEPDWNRLCLAVIDSRVSSFIRSYMSVGEYVRATNFFLMVETNHAELVRQHYPHVAAVAREGDGLLLHELFRREWQTFRHVTSIYLSGKAAQDGIQELEQIDHFYAVIFQSASPGGLEPFYERFRGVWAQVVMYIGYGYVTFNQFEQARRAYARSDAIFRQTPFRALHAEVKNNLARVLGELGALEEAIDLSNEVIAIRRSLGFDYLLAIAFNTRALIYTRNGRPITARELVVHARNICRRQNKQRGIGLTHIQYAEATRRWWNSLLDEARASGLAHLQIDQAELDQAAAGLREAMKIFGMHLSQLDELVQASEMPTYDQQAAKQLIRNEPPPEPLRILEALLELACLYRDQADGMVGIADPDGLRKVAERSFQIALLIASFFELRRHQLSAWIDLAWLYIRVGRLSEARAELNNAVANTPLEYRLTTSRSVSTPPASDIVYYRELSELSALQAELEEKSSAPLHDLLPYRILALVYIELFSPEYETPYLKLNRRNLRVLLEKLLMDGYTTTAIRTYVETVRSTYHLDVLRPGHRFSYETVVERVLASV